MSELPSRIPSVPQASFEAAPQQLPPPSVEHLLPPPNLSEQADTATQVLPAPSPDSQPVLAEDHNYFKRKELEEQGKRIQLGREIQAWSYEDEEKPQPVQVTPNTLPTTEYKQLFKENSALNNEQNHLISPAESNPVLQFPSERIKQRRNFKTWALDRWRNSRRAA